MPCGEFGGRERPVVRSVPEKTFEHWASMYVAHRFPLGGLWWPTAGEDIRVEDLGTVPGKSLLLEAKVPEQQLNGSHAITIDVAQLTKYLASPVPVYYIFPTPPWSGLLATSSWLGVERRADLAYRRAGHRWFGEWTQVCTAADLHAHLSPSSGDKFTKLKGLPATHWSWRMFWKEFRACGSTALQSAYVVDGPVADPTRSTLRGRLETLRKSRAQERPGGREAFFEALRDRQRYVYVPDRSSPEGDRYLLADDDDLSGSLSALLRSDDAQLTETSTQSLSVCHVPFTVLA